MTDYTTFDRRSCIRLSKQDWRYLYAINGAAAAAILLLAWIAGKV